MSDDAMKIERAWPPNADAIFAVFPWVKTTFGVMFAWDRTIFNPHGISITPSLMDHEQVHSIQQQGNPEGWWAKYLDSAEFRFREEVKAHICEYANIYRHHGRNKRRLYLDDIAGRLAGPLYGHLTTRNAAKRLLKQGAALLLAPQPEGN